MFAIDNCYIKGEQTSVKNSKEEEIKEYFRKRKERVNYVWWCQKGGEIKIKQKLKLDKKQNPKLWEKGGEIKLKQILKKLNKYWRN